MDETDEDLRVWFVMSVQNMHIRHNKHEVSERRRGTTVTWKPVVITMNVLST